MMNPTHKELAEKVIDVFKESDKPILRFSEDLAHLFPNINLAKKIINNLTEAEYLKLTSKGFFKITNKGLNFKSFADLDNKAEIENRKNILDLKLKEWQVKTFWWIFIIALISSTLGIYNFINNLSPSENIKQQEVRIKKMESELEKLQSEH
jgi:hypothetical protein